MNKDLPFSRRLPANLEPRTRFALEALGVASEIVEIQHRILIEKATAIAGVGDDKLHLDGENRLQMIVCVWSIIDQIDAMRQTLIAVPNIQLHPNNKFFTYAKAARKLRNNMDHLGGNLRKLSAIKEMMPIYGSIYFSTCRISDFNRKDDGSWQALKRHSILINLSGMQHNFKHKVDELMGSEVRYPIGDVYLHALGHQLNLSEAAQSVAEVRQFLEAESEAKWLATYGDAEVQTVPPPGVVRITETFPAPVELGHSASLDRIVSSGDRSN